MPTGGSNIALLTQHKLLSHNFGAFFITSFTDQICRTGYTVKIYEISPAEIAEKRLPPHLDLEETAGHPGHRALRQRVFGHALLPGNAHRLCGRLCPTRARS